jgi:hypothetical protein
VGSREIQVGVALTRLTEGFISVLAADVGDSGEQLIRHGSVSDSRIWGKGRGKIGVCRRG